MMAARITRVFGWHVQPITSPSPIRWHSQFIRQPASRCPRCLQLQTRVRWLSSQTPPPQRKGFLGTVIDNIKQEMARSKEMKENLKKFREEAQKLEDSDALKKAREKYQSIESETAKGSQQVMEQIENIKENIMKGIEEVQKTEIGKKGLEMTEELTKQARMAAQQVVKSGEQFSQSEAFKSVTKTVQAVREEMPISGARVYQPPAQLRKRKEMGAGGIEEKTIEANEEATGVELHKDSRWSQSWTNFKDNNPYVHKLFEWRMKYDESDNPIVRASRLMTDKVSSLFGGIFTKTELSDVLTEICKMEPDFDKARFLKFCETDVIPNILEAMIRADLDILKDWCHEAVFNVISTPIKQAQSMKYVFDSKILDIMNVDLVMGKMMEQGPVLIITFQTQQIMAVRDVSGNLVEGDPEKILRIHYVWVLCRDQSELDPRAAWKLMDMSANSQQQWL